MDRDKSVGALFSNYYNEFLVPVTIRKVQIQTVHLESAGSNPVRDKALVHTDGIATFPFPRRCGWSHSI